MLFLTVFRAQFGLRFGVSLGLLMAAQLATGLAWAQSSCSSDGQPKPLAVLERFISADCATCWSNPATLKTRRSDLVLDWIVPSLAGDEAPLSAAARQDALLRLQALNQPAPTDSLNLRRTVVLNPLALRVARGVALGGYMGASIAMSTPPHASARGLRFPTGPLTAWLVMIEDIPAGTDGTPVARQLVRNSLQINWAEQGRGRASDRNPPDLNQPVLRLQESRPMSIPEGANPDRLRVVGWVEDVRGRVISSAASFCVK